MSYDIVIVGGGPAGLACAKTAADRGMKPLVIERKRTIGKKICAGGITWNGLIQKVPGFAAEREFPSQFLFSRFQQAKITAEFPIIATVNREKLGRYMANIARNAGAEIRTSCLVKAIDKNNVTLLNRDKGISERIKYSYLVGADGSSSLVRRYLGIPVNFASVGINYQVPGDFPKMQWHFNSTLFRNGYAWVFPHTETASIGAFADAKIIQPALLKKNLLRWTEESDFCLKKSSPSAEFINFDYRGWQFKDNIFLAGDAAGLASGLTGEGIYPAIISGNAVAESITTPGNPLTELSRLIEMHKKHKKMASISGRSRFAGTIMSEFFILALRTKLFTFNKIEMAN